MGVNRIFLFKAKSFLITSSFQAVPLYSSIHAIWYFHNFPLQIITAITAHADIGEMVNCNKCKTVDVENSFPTFSSTHSTDGKQWKNGPSANWLNIPRMRSSMGNTEFVFFLFLSLPIECYEWLKRDFDDGFNWNERVLRIEIQEKAKKEPRIKKFNMHNCKSFNTMPVSD